MELVDMPYYLYGEDKGNHNRFVLVQAQPFQQFLKYNNYERRKLQN